MLQSQGVLTQNSIEEKEADDVRIQASAKEKSMSKKSNNGDREKFASRLGFILVSAGCAIGLGNVWKFPSVRKLFQHKIQISFQI